MEITFIVLSHYYAVELNLLESQTPQHYAEYENWLYLDVNMPYAMTITQYTSKWTHSMNIRKTGNNWDTVTKVDIATTNK